MRRTNPGYLQAVFTDGRVYRTTNGGLAWSLVFDLDLQGSTIQDAAWDPASGHVSLGTSSAGVVSAHPYLDPSGLPTSKVLSVRFSPAQHLLLIGTAAAGAFHQFLAPPVDAPVSAAPAATRLTVFPNPAAATTRFEFVVPEPGAEVRLAIYDPGGRLVRRVEQGWLAAGTRTPEWDGRDESGRPSPAGIYFVRVEIDGRWTTSKVVRLR